MPVTKHESARGSKNALKNKETNSVPLISDEEPKIDSSSRKDIADTMGISKAKVDLFLSIPVNSKISFILHSSLLISYVNKSIYRPQTWCIFPTRDK